MSWGLVIRALCVMLPFSIILFSWPLYFIYLKCQGAVGSAAAGACSVGPLADRACFACRSNPRRGAWRIGWDGGDRVHGPLGSGGGGYGGKWKPRQVQRLFVVKLMLLDIRRASVDGYLWCALVIQVYVDRRRNLENIVLDWSVLKLFRNIYHRSKEAGRGHFI